ncbi:MAG: sensor histidine kinase [Oscillatoria sp. SIO1A7]|nr:sensor histidine kinase [Oscillatoria sp. SIO1A7]
MFQATRRRLAIWYAIVTAVLLLLFATGFYLYVRNTLIERIDDTIEHVAEVVERSLVIQPANTQAITSQAKTSQAIEKELWRVNVEASFRDNTDAVEDDHIDIEWFSAPGELLWSTFSEPLQIPLHRNPRGETVRLVGLSHNLLLRQIVKRVEIESQVLGYLRVSHPWFEVTKPIRQLVVDLSLGIGLMVGGVAAIGWLLSGLAMEPVRESYQRLKQFTADASHELRSPIATIQTNVQVALAEPEADFQQQRRRLEAIERLARRMGRLVDDLLFLARQDSGTVKPRREPVHLDEVLMETIEEQQALTSDRDITISLDILESDSPSEPANIFTLIGDWQQLARLFANLVGNAVQYGRVGGRIEIELRRTNGNALEVRVRDNGIGIPPAELPRIFDRFYRVDPARQHSTAGRSATQSGSGLGLAIARAIVENHHGQIRFESQVDGGTTVTVILPG